MSGKTRKTHPDPGNTVQSPVQTREVGTPTPAPAMSSLAFCLVEGCDGFHHARGMCQAHYRRRRRHGDVQAERSIRRQGRLPFGLDPRIFGTDEEFWEYKVERYGEASARASLAEARELTDAIAAWRAVCGLPPLRAPSRRLRASDIFGPGCDDE